MPLDSSLFELLIEQASGDISVLSELLANVACDGKVSSKNLNAELVKQNIKANDKVGIINIVEKMSLPVLPLPPISKTTDNFKRQEHAWFNGSNTDGTSSIEVVDADLKLARALEAEEGRMKDVKVNEVQDDFALALSLSEEGDGTKRRKQGAEECNGDFAMAQALSSIDDQLKPISTSASEPPRFDISPSRQNHPLNEVKEILAAIQAAMTGVSSSGASSTEKFVDTSFVAGEIGCEMPEVLEWTRPQCVEVDIGTGVTGAGLKWSLFDGEPSSDDVCQGNLGDCWFLSALSVLAEYDSGSLIRSLLPFQGPTVSLHGAYVVRLCKGGCWEHVVVDDILPTTGGHIVSSSWMGSTKTYRQLAFAGTRGCRLWPAIVEKAYAKMCGGYANLSGGGSSEALHVLTGWPSRSIKLHQSTAASEGDELVMDDDMLWSTLISAKAAGHVLCASTGDSVQLGLRPNHAYAVTQVYEVTTDYRTGAVAKLLCLRNPHGRSSEGWQGGWGDNSSLWSSELREVCKVPKKGSFWMSLQDLKTYFHDVVVCRVNQSWVEARASGVMRSSFASPTVQKEALSGFKLEVYARTEVIIDLAQDFPRFSTCSSSDLSLLVLRIPSSPSSSSSSLSTMKQYELPSTASIIVSTPTSTDSSTSCDSWLNPGCYLLVPMTFNNCRSGQADSRSFSIAVMSSQPVLMEDVGLSPQPARKCACLYVTDPDKVKDVKRFQGAVVSTRTDGSSFYSHVAYPTNNSNSGGWGLPLIGSQPVQVDIGFEGSNMCHCRSSASTSDVILPGEEQLLAVVYSVGGASSYSYSYKYQTLPYGFNGRSRHTPEVSTDSIFHATTLG